MPYYELNPAVREALLADPADVEGALAAARDTFIARHPRRWVVGGDVGFATERAAWRFEAAWLSDEPATTEDFRYTELDPVEWVAGTDFFPGDCGSAGERVKSVPLSLADPLPPAGFMLVSPHP